MSDNPAIDHIQRVFDKALTDLNAKVDQQIDEFRQHAAEIDASIKHLTEQLRAMIQAHGQSDQMRAHSLQLALGVAHHPHVDAQTVIKIASEFSRFLKGQDRHDA